jgi:hypothetical protein
MDGFSILCGAVSPNSHLEVMALDVCSELVMGRVVTILPPSIL